jgi:hypothetical protein
MVVFPGLTESLGAVGKRISRFDTTDTLLSVQATSSVRRALCPTCSRGSSRRHGQYRRHLKARPCLGRSVLLHVQVRRFKCLNSQCPRKTFVEPIQALALSKLRRTVGFSGASCDIAQGDYDKPEASFGGQPPVCRSLPFMGLQQKACRPVWARPKMSACTSCVPS